MTTTGALAIAILSGSGCTGQRDVGGIDGDVGSDSDTDTDTDEGTDTGADADTDTDTETETDTGVDTDPCDQDYDAMDPVQTVIFNEVYFNVTDDQVELRNDGDTGQPLTRWVLATSPERVYPFPAGLTVPAGGFVVLHWTPLEGCDLDEEACGLGGFANDLTSAGGDLAIYRADDIDCPGALVDYVRWGVVEPADKGLGDVAREAGGWPEADYVDMGGYESGDSIMHDATDENGETHWYLDTTPTIGDPNDDCNVDEDCWGGLVCVDDVCQ